jgi:hypothetical protein
MQPICPGRSRVFPIGWTLPLDEPHSQRWARRFDHPSLQSDSCPVTSARDSLLVVITVHEISAYGTDFETRRSTERYAVRVKKHVPVLCNDAPAGSHMHEKESALRNSPAAEPKLPRWSAWDNANYTILYALQCSNAPALLRLHQ